jgi:hypothetical protein
MRLEVGGEKSRNARRNLGISRVCQHQLVARSIEELDPPATSWSTRRSASCIRPFGFDIDAPLATKTRMAFLDRAAADKTLVGSYHRPFPGFGHIVRERSGYRWLPADWQWTS